uniref:Uncharacterized protein n=1 Tax=Tanacetum cinerariifolium TaxID=118510 RepID=A0A6L2NZK4_TANCI|nr:hypothetical protein [Tanacetum cinerariifolium]
MCHTTPVERALSHKEPSSDDRHCHVLACGICNEDFDSLTSPYSSIVNLLESDYHYKVWFCVETKAASAGSVMLCCCGGGGGRSSVVLVVVVIAITVGACIRDDTGIGECSSCGTLYTRVCGCSKGTVEDKILVSKPSKNCAQCTRCGYLVDGPNCQGCAPLRQELEENLVTYSPYFQNTSEPSNASTNVVNAPREPYIVKQDNGSFVDNIIFDLNRAPDSPNQFHCFHCKDVLRAGEACKRCTCAKCGSGLGKGLCYICRHNQNSLNDSPSISETSSQSPPNVNHCCYECGDLLDGIFYKRCTCKSCGKDVHIGYNCPSKVPVISNLEPCNNQTIDELPQALPILHPTFHSEDESPFTLDSTPTYDFSESNEEFSSMDDDSFSVDDIDYVEASPPDSELVSSEVMEIVIPEVGGIDDNILLTIEHDVLREKISGSPTTHSDSSLYASFIFDLSINPFPPAGRSDFYEFTDELIPFISAPEYDCLLFKVEPNSRDFTMDVVEDIYPMTEPQVLTVFPTHPTLQLNMKFQPSNESLFAYVLSNILGFMKILANGFHYLKSSLSPLFNLGITYSNLID